MSEGQELAIRQLEEIAALGPELEIKKIARPTAEGGECAVSISILCTPYRAQARSILDGLQLRDREPFVIFIPDDFPFKRPRILADHDRFAESAHVQWRRQLCLYLAPDVEWNPSDGMYGFLDRLVLWLRAAAQNKLDPIDLPLHPPAIYASKNIFVVPTVDAPVVTGIWWAGEVKITHETGIATHLGEWRSYGAENASAGRSACAILLSSRMPYEYPSSLKELLAILKERHADLRTVRLVLELSALTNADDKPLYFLVGSPMRRAAGSDALTQHLACWYISAENAAAFRAQTKANENLDDDEQDGRFGNWAGTVPLEWCYVRENRPEIVVRRDIETPIAWWRGKTVSLLGCGAIGSTVAMLLARAGVGKLSLFDEDRITPGIGVRQIFDHQQVGYTKVSSTRVNVKAINPSIEIPAEEWNDIRRILKSNPDAIFNADVVINTTASRSVAVALESHFRQTDRAHPPLLSISLGHQATYGMATLTTSSSPHFAHDLERRLKVALTMSLNGGEYLAEFWPERLTSRKPFQPEPGCSEPTFTGSAADVMGLTAPLLNLASNWISAHDQSNRAAVMRAPHILRPSTQAPLLSFTWGNDRLIPDNRRQYQIRLAAPAERDMIGWINASIRKRGKNIETGGLLFGEIDDLLKIIWLSDVSGPPPDSVHSAVEFTCGTQGTLELHLEKQRRSRGSIQYIGMWHTHPGGIARPSPTDINAMRQLSRAGEMAARHFLMLIVGGHQPDLHFGGHVFGRDEF